MMTVVLLEYSLGCDDDLQKWLDDFLGFRSIGMKIAVMNDI